MKWQVCVPEQQAQHRVGNDNNQLYPNVWEEEMSRLQIVE